MQINLCRGSISLDGVVLNTRSRGLLYFVGLLAWRFRQNGDPTWVGMPEMSGVVGSAHPRQFQRYIDSLEDAGLRVIEYKAKTRGPWRLSPDIKDIKFDLPDTDLEKLFPKFQTATITEQPKSILLFNIVSSLGEVDRSFQNGQLADSLDAVKLAFGRQCGLDDDVELQVMLQLRIAKTCMRATLFDEAFATLEVASQVLKHQSVFHQELDFKIRLTKAKICYDRGFFAQAFTILDRIPIHECRDMSVLAQYHNLTGLFIHRRLRIDSEAGKAIDPQMRKEWLYSSISHFRRSLISYSFLNDFDGTQAACFNLGNLFAFVHKRQWLPAEDGLLEQAIQWIALSEQISNKQGVGGDSVWAMLVLIDIALSNDISLGRLREMTGSLLNQFPDYSTVGQWVHAEALRIGNQLEIAESHHLLAKIAVERGDKRKARENAIQAIALFQELGRNDLACPVKKQFSDPALVGGI